MSLDAHRRARRRVSTARAKRRPRRDRSPDGRRLPSDPGELRRHARPRDVRGGSSRAAAVVGGAEVRAEPSALRCASGAGVGPRTGGPRLRSSRSGSSLEQLNGHTESTTSIVRADRGSRGPGLGDLHVPARPRRLPASSDRGPTHVATPGSTTRTSPPAAPTRRWASTGPCRSSVLAREDAPRGNAGSTTTD